jgi:hypothetical protein
LASSAERKAAYDAYLLSEGWKIKRKEALDRAGNRCQVCNSAKRLDVHHRTYDRFGEESPEDLTVLCRHCHELFHGNKHVTRVKPQKRQRQGRGSYTKRHAACVVCGKNWTTKGTCKPCQSRKKVPVSSLEQEIGAHLDSLTRASIAKFKQKEGDPGHDGLSKAQADNRGRNPKSRSPVSPMR